MFYFKIKNQVKTKKDWFKVSNFSTGNPAWRCWLSFVQIIDQNFSKIKYGVNRAVKLEYKVIKVQRRVSTIILCKKVCKNEKDPINININHRDRIAFNWMQSQGSTSKPPWLVGPKIIYFYFLVLWFSFYSVLCIWSTNPARIYLNAVGTSPAKVISLDFCQRVDNIV